MKRLTIIKAVLALLIVSSLFPVSDAYALEKTGGSNTVVDSRDYPIIFIPGIAGSELNVGGPSGTNAWPGWLWSNDNAFKVLALKTDGRTPVDGTRVYATATVKAGMLDYFFPVYQGFYDYMEAQGYKLDTNPNGKVFFDFPYDFRQDNHRWTSLLDKKVDAVLKQTKADKVILVGHSMGGLQARLYMKDPNRAKKVAAVVFMGTPHHGSVMPFWAVTEGYNFGNSKLTDTRMWEISGNWEAGYQLLPDFPFIQDENGVMHGLDWINTENWISTQEYNHYLEAQKAGKQYDIHYGMPNRDFATASLAFHKELGNSVDTYPGVKYYMIEGTKQDTVQFLKARFVNVPGLPQPLLKLEKASLKAGDGTVPERGAAILGVEQRILVEAAHAAIPINVDAQKALTTIRKEVNNEDVRTGLVKKLTAYAKDNIARTARTTPSVSTGEPTIADLGRELLLMFIRGVPEPEKIKLRDEIKDMGLSLLRNARANMTVVKGVDKNNPDLPDHFYMSIVNSEVVDAGTGVITNATMNIQVDSLDTLQKAMASTDYLASAYQKGQITVQGTGIVNKLNAKIAKWISKYVKVRP